MKRILWRLLILAFAFVALFTLVAGLSPAPSHAQQDEFNRAPAEVLTKIDPRLIAALREGAAKGSGETSPAATPGKEVKHFMLLLTEQADLSVIRRIEEIKARRRQAYKALREVADRTQPVLITELDRMGLKHQPFWIVNMVLADTNAETNGAASQSGERQAALRRQVLELAARPDIRRVEFTSEGDYVLDEPPALSILPEPIASATPNCSSGWNTRWVQAPAVWSEGNTGQGITVATIDTGVEWDHEALKKHYRGWKGLSVDHNYNWWDGIREDLGSNDCGFASNEPCDDKGHGTHTMGTFVGRGPSKFIGVAPGAKWMACRGFYQGTIVPGAVERCLQFFLAPTDLNGQHPDPLRAPDIISHSYGVTPTEALAGAYEALEATGTIHVASAGNFASCRSIGALPGILPNTVTVGATMNVSDAISLFSSKGPGSAFPHQLKPDLVAPGQVVPSAQRGGGYVCMSGTSMSAPHVAGAIALLWRARPEFKNDIFRTHRLLRYNAVSRRTFTCASSFSSTGSPNFAYGFGTLNVKNLVDQGFDHCLQDDESGDTLKISLSKVVSDNGSVQSQATTAQYSYTNCASGLKITGVGFLRVQRMAPYHLVATLRDEMGNNLVARLNLIGTDKLRITSGRVRVITGQQTFILKSSRGFSAFCTCP